MNTKFLADSKGMTYWSFGTGMSFSRPLRSKQATGYFLYAADPFICTSISSSALSIWINFRDTAGKLASFGPSPFSGTKRLLLNWSIRQRNSFYSLCLMTEQTWPRGKELLPVGRWLLAEITSTTAPFRARPRLFTPWMLYRGRLWVLGTASAEWADLHSSIHSLRTCTPSLLL